MRCVRVGVMDQLPWSVGFALLWAHQHDMPEEVKMEHIQYCRKCKN